MNSVAMVRIDHNHERAIAKAKYAWSCYEEESASSNAEYDIQHSSGAHLMNSARESICLVTTYSNY